MNKILALISSVILAIYFIYSMVIIQQELTTTSQIFSWGYLSFLGFLGWNCIINNLKLNGCKNDK